MKKFDLDILQKYLLNKKLMVNVHPSLPLKLYKYSQNTVFAREWDDITMQMRGTVLDDYGNRISNPFEKFFNIQELDTIGLKLPNLNYKTYAKLDGSLIQIFLYKNNVIVTTPGSFESDQAKMAEQMLWNQYFDFATSIIEDGKTYLFELIHPDNKIVVDYGNTKKLILLAVRDLDGNEEDLNKYKQLGLDVVQEFDLKIDEIMSDIKKEEFLNQEGFVIRFDNGFRVKIKFDEYCRLHKILSNVNEKYVWEALKDGVDIKLENIPDETFQFIEDTKRHLLSEYDIIETNCKILFTDFKVTLMKKYGLNWNEHKKEYAQLVLPKYKKYSGILFRMFDDKEYSSIIWKMLKPKTVD